MHRVCAIYRTCNTHANELCFANAASILSITKTHTHKYTNNDFFRIEKIVFENKQDKSNKNGYSKRQCELN